MLKDSLLELGLRQEGSFTLKSGLTSNIFWDIERLFNYPEWVRLEVLRPFILTIGLRRPSLLIGIRTGGLLLAKDIGKCLDLAVMDDSYRCRQGLSTVECLPSIIVDDVLTTGNTVRKVIEGNSKVLAVAVLVNRSGLASLDGLPLISGVTTDEVKGV